MIIKTRTCLYDFNFELVWVTKYRQAVFATDALKADMQKILVDIADDNQIEIQEIKIMPDHIHLLVSFPPKYSSSHVVKTLKGGAGRRWFKEHPETKAHLWDGHLWSPSFYMATVGNKSDEAVTTYIENQITEYNAGRPRD